MIPKILHQVWLGDKKIPKQFIDYTEHYKKLHPNWDYILWNEDSLSKTKCWPFLEKAKKYSSKSNIARLYAVMNYGGVYSDFDIEWIKNIECFLVFKAFAAKESGNLYCNAFFGAEKGSKWVKFQYENTKYYLHKDPPWGPTLMTKACNRFPNLFTEIKTELIYPYYPYHSGKLKIQHELKKKNNDFKESYVVHHWDNSWKRE